MAELRTETMTVNMGPQHPSTHGVLRLVLELDGETVVSVSPTIGYLHTGIEKTAEQKKWQQVIPLVERMDYLGAQSNSLSYALSVEKLLGLEMPQRVKDIRVLIAELQRIASHLIWIGTHGLEIGAVSLRLRVPEQGETLRTLLTSLNCRRAVAVDTRLRESSGGRAVRSAGIPLFENGPGRRRTKDARLQVSGG